VPVLLKSMPTALRAILRRKMTPGKALLHPHKAPKEVRRIYDEIQGRGQRYELNLYVSGVDEETEQADAPAVAAALDGPESSPGAQT
jgi:succinate dehydrogenase / fumarate reductase iron-sulfur subunit